MTEQSLSSVDLIAAGKASEDTKKLENSAQHQRGFEGGNPNRGTGNSANHIHKQNEGKGYFANNSEKLNRK